MKKNLLFITALFCVKIIMANPVASPSITLSELAFDNDGKWVIELFYADINKNYMPIDSIWIKTSSGISRVKRFNIIGSEGVIVIRNDSMLSNLSINPQKDSIQIIYNMVSINTSSKFVVYGSFPNTQVKSPIIGQSIAGIPPYFKYDGLYSIDKSPTIGTLNDSIGMCGVIKGHIYDKNNQLLSNTTEKLYVDEASDFFYPNPDGSYSIRLYSKKNHIYNLYSYGSKKYVNITPIDAFIAPDTIVYVDIHLLDSLKVDIVEINQDSESIMNVYPNPISGLEMNYEIDLPVKSSNCFILIVNLMGQNVLKYQISESKGIIYLPSDIKAGLYTVNLFLNDKKYYSVKIVIK